MRETTFIHAVLAATILAGAPGCGDEGVSSDEEARRAYLGLDTSIEKALGLGMDGYNAATSANIPEQTAAGDLSGMLIINGQVDQGVSPNKEMRLLIGMIDYSDGVAVTVEDVDINIAYTTNQDPLLQPALDLSLRDIPDGTFTGTLLGTYSMTGDLEGDVTLNLTLSGEIESNGAGGIRRKLGTTQVTGTATSGDGTYDIVLTI